MKLFILFVFGGVLAVSATASDVQSTSNDRSKRSAEEDLIQALWAQNLTKAENLLKNDGINVNFKDHRGWSPINVAAEFGHIDIVQMLIDRNADFNNKDERGNSPLHDAAWNDQAQVLQLLLDKGALINNQNNNGNTPLHHSASKGHKQIAEILLKRGANVGIVNSFGQKARDIAVAFGNSDIVRLFDEPIQKYENIRRACQKYSRRPLTDFILNGIPAKQGDFPWMAALGYLNSNLSVSFKCGGTLISEEFVLTAAHCVRSSDPPVVIKLGKLLLTDPAASNYFIQEIIKHPNYSSATKKNDIALLRLTNHFNQFTESIRPACLELDPHDIDPSVSLNISGWGATSPQSNVGTNELHKAEVRTVPLSQCNATFLEFNKDLNHAELRNGISESQYCAQNLATGSDSCYGDSGGPLHVFRNSYTAHVVGITSFGIQCGFLPGIYTRVAYYLDWIESHVWPN